MKVLYFFKLTEHRRELVQGNGVCGEILRAAWSSLWGTEGRVEAALMVSLHAGSRGGRGQRLSPPGSWGENGKSRSWPGFWSLIGKHVLPLSL